MTQHFSDLTDDLTIYKHDTRPDWGNAILAWEREDKRGYQFEDGKLRIFKDGWFHRLEEVDQPLPRAAAIAERLQRKLGLTPMRAAARYDGLSFDDQLVLFEHFYPDGFAGDAWRSDKRGDGAGRRLKRHRDAAVADARTELSADALDALIVAERYDDAWDAILGVLRRTDLVTKRHIDPITELDADARRKLVVRVRELLWGDNTFELRFERFVGTLATATGAEPTWRLATALMALVHPQDHICIRSSSARAQASWMAPKLPWSRVPSAQLYERLQRMAHTVRSELTDAGYTPADLLDVLDFMWTTLRPKARKQLDEVKAAAARRDRASGER